ncbi:dienelactone hydrolase family protein [Cytophagaceae bacterium ABcell3]|nr:dienelactone hydrolase family protein [Cytophagaceae bacterium ABcell3]
MYIIRNEVEFPAGTVKLQGELSVPEDAIGLVIFSHGSGSSRHSERNKQVAARLQENGFATFLFDLLTEEEDRVFENRFNISRLADRLVSATRWVTAQNEVQNLRAGFFGASTGAASALLAACRLGKGVVQAVVSRGGRPDLAEGAYGNMETPTLLIVGGLDDDVLQLNQKALEEIKSEKALKVVEGATHLFEESGTLEEVAELAATWFSKYLGQNESIRV